MKTFFRFLTAALQAYVEHIRWQRDRYIDGLEDRLDALAADGSADSKLRIERVSKRLKRERERIIRSANSDAD